MRRFNKKEKEYLLGIEPKYLLSEPNWDEDPNPIPDYLCFVSEELGAKITVSATRYSFTANLEYSTDKVNWINFPITEYFTSGDIPLEQNVPIYLRGDNPDGFSKDKQKYFGFQFNKNTSCSGNIMTLIKN